MNTRTVVYTSIIAALYISLTIMFAPISYGLIQFRISEILKVLALYSPIFSLGFGIGTFISNIASPFGIFDWGFMPFVDIIAALICYKLRSKPISALIIQSIIISAGVAIFPLGLGGRIPIFMSFIYILISELIILLGGYIFIWKFYSSFLNKII